MQVSSFPPVIPSLELLRHLQSRSDIHIVVIETLVVWTTWVHHKSMRSCLNEAGRAHEVVHCWLWLHYNGGRDVLDRICRH